MNNYVHPVVIRRHTADERAKRSRKNGGTVKIEPPRIRKITVETLPAGLSAGFNRAVAALVMGGVPEAEAQTIVSSSSGKKLPTN